MCTASSSSSRRILRSSLQQQSHAEPDEGLEFLGRYSDDNVCDQNRQALYHDSSEVEETVVRPMTPFELARYRHDQLRRRARTTLAFLPFTCSLLARYFHIQTPYLFFPFVFTVTWMVFKDFRTGLAANFRRDPPNLNIPDIGPNARPIENPKRSWSESLADDWPFTLGQTQHGVKKAFSTIQNFIAFQTVLQFLVTLAQHLGVHFLHGEDVVGLFPRYQANLMSTQNLFGAGGFAAFTAHYSEIFGFWNDWVNGIWWNITWDLPVALWNLFEFVGKLVWDLMLRGVAIPGEAANAEEWLERRAQRQLKTQF